MELTLSQEAVHHGFHDVQLLLDAEVDKVGIEDDEVGWSKRAIVCEEKVCRIFGAVAEEIV